MPSRRAALRERELDQRASDATDKPVAVQVRNLTKIFRREDGRRVPANDGICLDVLAGEFLVLLGPSGCGKTTLLRSVGGLETPDSGSIDVFGTTVYSSERRVNVPPEKRRMSMIFQSYALWPHMTVFENVAYPLRARGEPRSRIGDRVRRVLQQVGIAELEDQYPGRLSGGQQQRVAVARAIVSNDSIVLFDEPLSNVDAKVREQVRLELLAMQRELGFAALHVTHDQFEAMELASRIAVMRAGRIEQLGTPREVYEQPVNRYVANFVGRANELTGRLRSSSAGEHVIESTVGSIVVGSAVSGVQEGESVVVICRPERCELGTARRAETNSWSGVVIASLFVGAYMEHLVRVGDSMFKVASRDFAEYAPGDEVWISAAPASLRVLPAGAVDVP